MKKHIFIRLIIFTIVIMCGISTFASGATGRVENNVLIISGTGEYTVEGESWVNEAANIQEVIIENGVSSIIGQYAFYYCENLKKITIPDTLTKIDAHAFKKYDEPVDVYINDISAWLDIEFERNNSNPLICGGNLYKNNKLVKELIIPEDKTTINKFAFYNYNGLETVFIHDGVTEFGMGSFKYCNEIKNVYYSGTKQQWDNITRNTEFLSDKITYDYKMPVKIEASKEDGKIKVLVYGTEDVFVVCGYYKQNRMIYLDVAQYIGDELEFNADIDYDSIKVFAFSDFDRIMPLCEEVVL